MSETQKVLLLHDLPIGEAAWISRTDVWENGFTVGNAAGPHVWGDARTLGEDKRDSTYIVCVVRNDEATVTIMESPGNPALVRRKLPLLIVPPRAGAQQN